MFKTDTTPWLLPKVIVNGTRRSRSRPAWRMDAVVGPAGFYASQRFHGIWPTSEISVSVIAAVLNSPISNIILSLGSNGRDNILKELLKLPFPKITASISGKIENLVDEYISLNQDRPKGKWPSYTFERSREILTIIDANILLGYGLTEKTITKAIIYYINGDISGDINYESLSITRSKVLDKHFSGMVSNEDLRIANFSEWLLATRYEYSSVLEAMKDYGDQV